MKTKNLILMGFLILAVFPAFAQKAAEPKVIAVINQADWCHVCKENGQRAMAAFMANNQNGAFLFVANDVTNADTKKKSAMELKKYGLDKAAANLAGTGVAYFFNPKTRELISQVSVGKTDQELAAALKNAEAGLN